MTTSCNMFGNHFCGDYPFIPNCNLPDICVSTPCRQEIRAEELVPFSEGCHGDEIMSDDGKIQVWVGTCIPKFAIKLTNKRGMSAWLNMTIPTVANVQDMLDGANLQTRITDLSTVCHCCLGGRGRFDEKQTIRPSLVQNLKHFKREPSSKICSTTLHLRGLPRAIRISNFSLLLCN